MTHWPALAAYTCWQGLDPKCYGRMKVSKVHACCVVHGNLWETSFLSGQDLTAVWLLFTISQPDRDWRRDQPQGEGLALSHFSHLRPSVYCLPLLP